MESVPESSRQELASSARVKRRHGADGGEDSQEDGTKKGGGTTMASTKRQKPSASAAKSSTASSAAHNKNGDFTTDPAKLAMMSRSERKRHREKKRRSDVNKGFEELINLLVEIDDGVRGEVEEERARRAQVRAEQQQQQSSSSSKGGNGGQVDTRSKAASSATASSPPNGVDDNILSRVDLIDRATTVLRRIHAENEQRKKIVDQLLANGRAEGALVGGPATAAAHASLLPSMFDRPTMNHPRGAPTSSLGYGGMSAPAEDPVLASLLAAAATGGGSGSGSGGGGGSLGSAALVQREALIQHMELRQLLAGGGGLHGTVAGGGGAGGGPDWALLQARAGIGALPLHSTPSSSSFPPLRAAASQASMGLSNLPLSQGELIRLATSRGLELPTHQLQAVFGSTPMEPNIIRALLLQQQQQRELGGGGPKGIGRDSR